jgi:hypothetical protein
VGHAVGEGEGESLGGGDEEHVPGHAGRAQQDSQGLSQAASGSVPQHCLAEAAPGHHGQSRCWWRGLIGGPLASIEHGTGRVETPPFTEHPMDVGFPAEGVHAGALPGGCRRQPLAAFGAATAQDVAAAGRTHTSAKAVSAQASAPFRLIGSLHSGPPESVVESVTGFIKSARGPAAGAGSVPMGGL